MENQHRVITGYRDLTAEEIGKMNEIKTKAEEVGALVESLKRASLPFDPDQRWVSLGATQLQQGFMALIRAVAKPTTF